MKVLAIIQERTAETVGTLSGAVVGMIVQKTIGEIILTLGLAFATGVLGYFGTLTAKWIHSKFKK